MVFWPKNHGFRAQKPWFLRLKTMVFGPQNHGFRAHKNLFWPQNHGFYAQKNRFLRHKPWIRGVMRTLKTAVSVCQLQWLQQHQKAMAGARIL